MTDDRNRPLRPGELYSHTPHRGLGPRPVDVAGVPVGAAAGLTHPANLPPVEPAPLPDRDVPFGEANQVFRK
jgi:hypothetical protein